MGLDMYLTRKVYIGAKFEHRNAKINVSIELDGKPVKIDSSKISYILEEVGYWRKSNQIHKWFVDHVQDGKDDCNEYYVSRDQLKELLALCEETIKTKDADLLPPQSGFFFGSTEIDQYYWEDLKATIELLKSLKLEEEDRDGDFYYQSSW